ncbi:MAG: outer membrane protein assembly factor BamA [Deltaproteobacteria bacterium]|nr:outer membrane protein assembly factor BamA [Deltaproteobacteria bacterium]NND27549.1 outer membrane protein assembly factor BamA [Myxococcales bacterium]MBT8465598.1 outer membrane protein assembly factor BamA [Deltaproteobacteria bacterium]MBT8480537.1 outer membrane protein assembly factor BamA [Deltaproteobacteria bacterium]NNK08367.1 outer membrane protein assembly factor BamA [Myxococcales bacterium]
MPDPPPPATRPVRASPRPQRPPEPLPGEPEAEGDDYEPVEDPDEAIKVPRTSCHGKEIRRISVIGARRVDPDDVRVTMKLRRGSICTDPAVTRDAKALWNMAYFDDLQFESDPLGAGIKLTVRLVERPAIRKVIYRGNDELDQEDIDETITLEPGTILSVPDVESQADAMRQLYAEEGFFLAEVDYDLKRIPGDTNQVDIVFKIDEGAEVEVRRISIVGNEELPAAELLKIMQTNETGMFSFLSDRNKFSRAAFDEDLTRVQAWYYDKGYLQMRPGRPTVALTADRAFVDITIPVEEGPRYRIREFDVMETDGAGNEVETIAPKGELREMVKLDAGDWFSRSKIAEGIEEISRAYRDSGYALVEMVPGTDLDETNHLVDVTINILRGPPVYIERLHVRGNTKTRDAVIRREFRLSEGDLYNQSRLEDGRALVNQLGYFERVDVSEEQGTARDQMVINVEVAEKPTGTFQVGAGFSSLESFIITAQIQQQNLFGRGQSLGLNLQVSGIRQQIDLNFVEPWFLGSEWSLGFGIFKRIRDFRDFRQDSTGANLTTGHPLFNPRFRIFLRYEFENVKISQPRGGLLGVGGGQLANTFSNIFIADAFRDGITSSLRLTLNWDSRDNRLSTTGGIFANYAVQFADQYLGSDNTFIRQTAFARFYKKAFGPVIFKVNAEMGLLTSRKKVPVFERFYLGGIFTIRGYRLQSVGPQAGVASAGDPNLPIAFEGRPIGGDFQAFYNIEFEFPLIEAVGIRAVIFTDGGNAWNVFDFRDQFGNCQAPVAPEADRSSRPCGISGFLRYSVGFGVRWFSPLGPLRFEWGIPIRRRPQDAPIRFEFTIGQSF